MATKSASNVAERAVVSTAASAMVKGTHGSGFAASLVSFLEAKAQAAIKIQVSLKDKLKGFYDFSEDDFDAYFGETRKWREQIKADAEKAKLTVTKYRESAPGIDYVYVSLSEFDRLARAVKTGWRPEVDRLTWAAIKAEATMRLDSAAKMEKINAAKEELAKVAADDKMDPALKAAKVLVLNKELESMAETQPTGKGAGQGSTVVTKTNFDRATEMLDKFPLQDLQMVAAWLQKRLEAADKVAPTIKTATTGTDPVTRGNKAAATRQRRQADMEEHATAKGNKRQSKRGRK